MSASHRLALFFLPLLCAFSPGQQADCPLPRGTIALVQINLPAWTASPLLKPLYQAWGAAGKDLTDTFLQRLPLAPADVQAFTGVLYQTRPKAPPSAVFLVQFKKAFDLAKLAVVLDFPEPTREGGREMSATADMGLMRLDEATLAVGIPAALQEYAKLPPEDRPAWKEVLALAGKEAFSVWSTVDPEVLLEDARIAMQKAVGPLLDSLQGATVAGLNLNLVGDGAVARAVVLYGSDKLAEASLENWKLQTRVVRGFLKTGEGIANIAPALMALGNGPGMAEMLATLGLPRAAGLDGPFGSALCAYLAGTLAELDDSFAKMEFARSGNAVSLTGKLAGNQLQVGVPAIAVAIGLLVPAVQKVREAANRMQASNNLKQIGLALHNYASANGRFPPAMVLDKDGKALYSWRVLILPYIEQDAVYKQWKMDESWDSPNNKKLSDMMVKVYQDDPAAPPSNQTRYRVFFGGGALFDAGKPGQKSSQSGTGFADITDGTSNTLMVVEAGEAVPWAAPVELAFKPKGPLPRLGLPGRPLFQALLADGSVRAIARQVDEVTIKAMITRAGGEAYTLP